MPTGEGIEWAVETKEELDGEFDRFDDGSTWSHRRGQKYTQAEAHKEAERFNRRYAGSARVVHRYVSAWTTEEDE